MGQLLEIKVFDSVEKLAAALAAQFADYIKEVLKEKDHFDLVLAGGESPRPLYRFLAENYRNRIAWDKIRFFWSDERFVPHNDHQSNYGMAKETLLDHVPVELSNIFPMPTSFNDPTEAATSYEKFLKSHFDSAWPHFDLTLLGLGDDCHVASLFPHATTLAERVRWVVTSLSSKEPRQRLSLTLPAINGSKKIYFIVTGERKAGAVKKALSKGQFEIEDCPARGVRLTDGEIVWWLDKAAAKFVEEL